MSSRPFEQVLIATDFSRGAARALGRAMRLPLTRNARLSILHVLPEGMPQALRVVAEDAARHQIEHEMRAAAAWISARGGGARVTAELCAGEAHIEIIRHARSAGAELVVLGRHGQRPIRDMFIGSSAERVIRLGDLPILVVDRKASKPYRRPLVAVDLEDTSRAVVDLALRALGPEANRVRLVHAYQVPFEGFMSPGASASGVTALRKEYRGTAETSLTRLLAALGDRGVDWHWSVHRGDPRAVVLAEAVLQRADLLVLGTHGRTGLAHALHGSIAEWVIQAAPTDVLVARPARTSFELP